MCVCVWLLLGGQEMEEDYRAHEDDHANFKKELEEHPDLLERCENLWDGCVMAKLLRCVAFASIRGARCASWTTGQA